MDEATIKDERQEAANDSPEPDAEPEEITEEEVQHSLEKLLPRYEQMLRNLAE